MKIGLFTDVHWSKTTNILRSRGEKYSTRLELLIKSLTWAFKEFEKRGALSFCAGDFFDKPVLNEEEITALSKVDFSNCGCFIVGNHESSRADLQFTSVDAIDAEIIKEVKLLNLDNVQIYLLPYVSEYDRKPLKEYLKDYDSTKKHIIISHNDIKNVQYGEFLSKVGFSVEEIEECCDLYLNGHIHNGSWITKKILNLGSLTAHNFTNDSFAYKYGIWILDVDTLELEFVENPYSLNFYKFDVNSEEDLHIFNTLKSNAVVSCKCKHSLKEALEKVLRDTKNILTYKITYVRDGDVLEASNEEIALTSKDHLEQFKEYIIQTLGSSEVVQQELLEVCK